MLKELLGDKWTQEIDDLLKDKVEAVGSGENKIPKVRFDQVNNAKKELEEQVKTFQEEISKLTANNTDVEQLKKQLEEKSTEFANYQLDVEKKQVNAKKANDIVKLLNESNALNPKLLVKEFNLDEVSYDDDGKLVGVKTTLENLKKDYAPQFGKQVDVTPNVQDGGGKSITKDAFKNMGYKERVQFKADKPEEYKALTE